MADDSTQYRVSFETQFEERPGEWFPHQALHTSREDAEAHYATLQRQPETTVRLQRIEVLDPDNKWGSYEPQAQGATPSANTIDGARHEQIVDELEADLKDARATVDRLEHQLELRGGDEYTGTLYVQGAHDGGVYAHLNDTNGETLMHSEVYTGHRSPQEIGESLREAMRNPELVVGAADPQMAP